jgi:hypothetical protein
VKLRLALGATAAAAVVAVGITPASAYQDQSADSLDCVQGIACFYETTSFSGRSFQVADPSASCTRLPFAPGSLFNWSTEDIYLYRTTDCTGTASLEPANNFHSYPSTKFLSYRAG